MTTMLGTIEEFSMYGVYDAGSPNLERVVLRANMQVDTGGFILMLGIKGPGDTVIPLRDNMLWFGNSVLEKGDWLFVYTGKGEPRGYKLPNSEEHVYSVHWGRSETIFMIPELVPVIVRVDAMQFPATVPALSHSQRA